MTKQHKHIVSQFWKLEVQDDCDRRVGFFQALGDLLCASCLASGGLLAIAEVS